MADDLSMNPTRDDFAALLDESMGGRDFVEGTVVKGMVAAIEKDFAIIDVGLKTEGRIPVKEFGVDDDGKPTLKVGDTVEVFLERDRERAGRGGDQPRQGPPRGSLDPPGRRSTPRTSRSWAPSSAA